MSAPRPPSPPPPALAAALLLLAALASLRGLPPGSGPRAPLTVSCALLAAPHALVNARPLLSHRPLWRRLRLEDAWRALAAPGAPLRDPTLAALARLEAAALGSAAVGVLLRRDLSSLLALYATARFVRALLRCPESAFHHREAWTAFWAWAGPAVEALPAGRGAARLARRWAGTELE